MSAVQIVTTLIGSLGGVGGLSAGAVFLWKAWVGRQERRAARAAAQAQDLDLAFTRLVKSAERQDVEIARQDKRIDLLTEQRREDRARLEEVEKANRRLAEENRTFRAVLLGVMERLRRRPPDDHESILAYIREHVPHLRKDPS